MSRHADGVVILCGDDGGQVYAVIPAATIRCSSVVLRQLVLDLDARAWPLCSRDKPSIRYARVPKGTQFNGGLGGVRSTGSLWVHDEFKSVKKHIAAVVAGKRRSVEFPAIYIRAALVISVVVFACLNLWPGIENNSRVKRYRFGWPDTFVIEDEAARWFDKGLEVSQISGPALLT